MSEALPSRDALIWIDLEMTGLQPQSDTIIEIATLVTDSSLRLIAEGPVFAIHQDEPTLARMDAWNQRQHGGSGDARGRRIRDARVPGAACRQRGVAHVR